jgi:tetratricopeptide (TPR) repeat protein
MSLPKDTHDIDFHNCSSCGKCSHKSDDETAPAADDTVRTSMQQLFEEERFDEIWEECEEALDEDENNAVAYFWQGLINAHEGDFEQAVKKFEQALKNDSKNALYYFHRGSVYAQLGNIENAIADYSNAINYNPKDWLNYVNRGILYLDNKMYEKADADFTESINLSHGSDPKPYFFRGIVSTAQKEYLKALDDFKKVTLIDPENSMAYTDMAYHNLALCCEVANKIPEAICAYQNFIEIAAPDMLETKHAKARLEVLREKEKGG